MQTKAKCRRPKKLQEFQLSRKLKIKFEVCSDNDNSLHEKKQAWNDTAWIKFYMKKVFQMQHLYDHISSGHEKKKKKPSNAAFATIALHQNEIWIIIFHQFMRIKSLSNAAFVMVVLHQNTLHNHISSVHENKKPFKCSICNDGFTLKILVVLGPWKYKPFKRSICDADFTS